MTKAMTEINERASPYSDQNLSINDIWKEFGMPGRGEKLFDAIHNGFRFNIYEKLSLMTGIKRNDFINMTGISSATLSRRANHGRFNVDESDKLYRIIEVIHATNGLFEGKTSQAMHWLKQPAHGLGGKTPYDMLSTSAETEAVLDFIQQLEHGVTI